ncbi:hypothetical protein JZ751_009684 [Albula glossodonta]|uniref:Uncharacterized protein n=1 Tax=Albula glossodonta TaxID=121402 RepID=A0A8T2P1A8_9TELE|nr:hypothetical protein JZ751_009684 [Albula glossodonta]
MGVAQHIRHWATNASIFPGGVREERWREGEGPGAIGSRGRRYFAMTQTVTDEQTVRRIRRSLIARVVRENSGCCSQMEAVAVTKLFITFVYPTLLAPGRSS